jgi:hypothetical protein
MDSYDRFIYHFILKLGTSVLQDRLSADELKKAHQEGKAFHCTLCTMRALTALGHKDE